jgi:transcription elongation factor GreA
MKTFPITLLGLDKVRILFKEFQNEKKYWTKEKRIAAELGDRSENAEYISAKENIRRIDKLLFRYDKILKTSSIIPELFLFNKICFGNIVLVKNIETNEFLLVRIVGTNELDIQTLKNKDILNRLNKIFYSDEYEYLKEDKNSDITNYLVLSKMLNISSISPLGKSLLILNLDEESEVSVNNIDYDVISWF